MKSRNISGKGFYLIGFHPDLTLHRKNKVSPPEFSYTQKTHTPIHAHTHTHTHTHTHKHIHTHKHTHTHKRSIYTNIHVIKYRKMAGFYIHKNTHQPNTKTT